MHVVVMLISLFDEMINYSKKDAHCYKPSSESPIHNNYALIWKVSSTIK